MNTQKKLTKNDKIKILADFKADQALIAAANKRIQELKDQIKADIEAGVYGDFALSFEKREVKSYQVEARVDLIIKVQEIKS